MVLDPPHRKRPGECREVADRIDRADPGRAGEEGGGQRPEHRQAGHNAEASHAKREHLQRRIIERRGDSDYPAIPSTPPMRDTNNFAPKTKHCTALGLRSFKFEFILLRPTVRIYLCKRDGSGASWKYFPAARIDCRMVHTTSLFCVWRNTTDRERFRFCQSPGSCP